MALTAETKTQSATGSGTTALSLLASLKAGLKGVKSGGFDALLAAVDNALPQQTAEGFAQEKEAPARAAPEETTRPQSEKTSPAAEAIPLAHEETRRSEKADSADETDEDEAISEKEALAPEEVHEEALPETFDQDIGKTDDERSEETVFSFEDSNASEQDAVELEDGLVVWAAGQAAPRETKPAGVNVVDEGEIAEGEGDLDADAILENEGDEASTWGALLGFSLEAREEKADAFVGAWRVSSGVQADADALTLQPKDSEGLTLSPDSSLPKIAADSQTTTEGAKAKTPLETFFGAIPAQVVEQEPAPIEKTEGLNLQAILTSRGGVPAAEVSDSSQQTAVVAANSTASVVQPGTPVVEARALPVGTSGATTNAIAGIGSGARAGSSYHFAMLHAEATAEPSSTSRAHLVEQVSVQLRKMAKDGTSEMTIQLRPEDLGEIEIKLEFKEDKKVQGTIVAEKASTLQLLQKDADALQRVLQEAGLQADSGSLEFSLRDGGRDSSSTWAEAESADNGFYAEEDVFPSAQAEVVSEEIYYVTPQRVNLRV